MVARMRSSSTGCRGSKWNEHTGSNSRDYTVDGSPSPPGNTHTSVGTPSARAVIWAERYSPASTELAIITGSVRPM